MCVKCQLDGELPVGRKSKIACGILCIPLLHMTDIRKIPAMRSFSTTGKGGIFYVANEETICRLF